LCVCQFYELYKFDLICQNTSDLKPLDQLQQKSSIATPSILDELGTITKNRNLLLSLNFLHAFKGSHIFFIILHSDLLPWNVKAMTLLQMILIIYMVLLMVFVIARQ
jgi:hypothetical protein